MPKWKGLFTKKDRHISAQHRVSREKVAAFFSLNIDKTKTSLNCKSYDGGLLANEKCQNFLEWQRIQYAKFLDTQKTKNIDIFVIISDFDRVHLRLGL